MTYIELLGLFTLPFFLCFIASTFFPSASFSFYRFAKKKYKKVEYNHEYYRDILSYRISEVYYIYNNLFNKYWSTAKDMLSIIEQKKIFKDLILINILKMHKLKLIDLEFINNCEIEIKKKEIVILDGEYKFVVDFIFNVVQNKSVVSLYEVNNYIDNCSIEKYFLHWDNYIKKCLRKKGICYVKLSQEDKGFLVKFYVLSISFWSIFVFLVVTRPTFNFSGLILWIIILACGYGCGLLPANACKVLTNYAVYEQKKIKALKKFLIDFSNIESKDWEYYKLVDDYMIYAIIFKINKNTKFL